MQSIALVGMNGSIDFLCYPDFDSPTIFAALLDDKKGGRFEIRPQLANVRVRQLYLPDTNILLTRQMSTPWDALHRAYFNGEALWNYLTTPFLLAMDGVRVEETEAWREGTESWCVLRAYFPGSIETHSTIQDFFFGDDLLLRRHDYAVNISGGFAAAQVTSDYVVKNGISLPTKRRAYTRGPDRRPILEMLMVSIDLSDIRFE